MAKKEKQIDIDFIPGIDVKDGLLCLFHTDTEYETNVALADIKKGQQLYSFPDDKRKVRAVYLKLL